MQELPFFKFMQESTPKRLLKLVGSKITRQIVDKLFRAQGIRSLKLLLASKTVLSVWWGLGFGKREYRKSDLFRPFDWRFIQKANNFWISNQAQITMQAYSSVARKRMHDTPAEIQVNIFNFNPR